MIESKSVKNKSCSLGLHLCKIFLKNIKDSEDFFLFFENFLAQQQMLIIYGKKIFIKMILGKL